MTKQEENEQIERARKNPDCYDEQGGYIGPGADRYGSTQRVDEHGEPCEMMMTCDNCGAEVKVVHACESCGAEVCQECVESEIWSPVIGLCAGCNPGATDDATITHPLLDRARDRD